MGLEDSEYLKKPTRATPRGRESSDTKGQEQMQVSAKYLTAASRETSRSNRLLRSRRRPSRGPAVGQSHLTLRTDSPEAPRRGPSPARPPPPIPRPEAPPEGLGHRPPTPQPALSAPEPSSAGSRPHFPQPNPAPALQDRPSTPGPLHTVRRSPSSKGRGDLGGPKARTGLRPRSPSFSENRARSAAAAKLSHPGPGHAPSPAAGNRKRSQGPAPPPAEARPRRLRPWPLSAPPREPTRRFPGLGKKRSFGSAGRRGEALAGRRGAASLARAVLPRLFGPERGWGPPWGEGGVGRSAPGLRLPRLLRLPPLLRLLPFP